jgi:hypothetical protein
VKIKNREFFAMPTNHLNNSKKKKADEFYTLYKDIEEEMEFHKQHFKDKIVYCNCDNPYESNFFKYFAINFNNLGLKRLVATHYAGSDTKGQRQLFARKDSSVAPAYKMEVNKGHDFEFFADCTSSEIIAYLLEEPLNSLTKLKGSGDFRSSECINILQESDIVVTNPPFSLFGDFFNVLVKYNKKFLVIGGTQAISYSNVFPLLKSGEVNLGLGFRQGGLTFQIPDSYELVESCGFIGTDGKKYQNVTVRWYTNLPVEHYNYVQPSAKYSEEKYKKFDNYDAIEVTRTDNIPCDYYGVMGVPLTAVGNFDPRQFKIVGVSGSNDSVHLITKQYGNVKLYDSEGVLLDPAFSLKSEAVIRLEEKPDTNYSKIAGDDGFFLTRFVRVFIQRIREQEPDVN